ncbi:MAG: hypothetical protein QXG39_08295 [Candidatus Aenigmatarchaeota archaeon]
MEVEIKDVNEEIRKRVDEALSTIKNIKFFQPHRSLKKANSFVPKIDEIIENYTNSLRRWKKDDGTYFSTYYAARYVAASRARNLAKNVGRENLYESAYYAGWNVVKDVILKTLMKTVSKVKVAEELAWNVSHDTANYVGWEVIKDLPGFEENPFGYIVEEYKMGFKPVGFRKVNGEEKYVVDIPVIIKGRKMLGCYASGDGEILWMHKWEDDHKNLKYLKKSKSPNSRLRIIKPV